jgi:hypothetical protein
MYPNLLPAMTDPAQGITVYNAAAPGYGLKVGAVLWSMGMAIALGNSHTFIDPSREG